MTREEIIEQLDSIVGTYEILLGNGVNSDILDVDDIEAIREAISALSAEPCDDCISRAEALKCLEFIGDKKTLDEVYERQSKLPSVQPINKWIPVSERLPEEGKNVLFCDIDNDIMLGYHLTYAPATHFVEKGSWEDMKNVFAWQPLPEPYKAESEDT